MTKNLYKIMVISFLVGVPLLVGCGSRTKKEIKDYVIHVESDNAAVQKEFKALIDMFNVKSCLRALRQTDDPGAANSRVFFTKGLHARDGKVGWGQWRSAKFESDPGGRLQGKDNKVTTVYSMELEFDEGYILDRLASEYEMRRLEMFKLFSHEVGHGLTMGHDEDDTRSVMYPDVSGEKDFEPFFERVRSFFGTSVEDVSC